MTEEFIAAACVARSAHASGTLEEAEAILAAHPEVADGDAAPLREILDALQCDAT